MVVPAVERLSLRGAIRATADIAVLGVEKGDFGFVDSYGARLAGSQRLRRELTLRAGRVVYYLDGPTREDWRKLGKYGPQSPSWRPAAVP